MIAGRTCPGLRGKFLVFGLFYFRALSIPFFFGMLARFFTAAWNLSAAR